MIVSVSVLSGTMIPLSVLSGKVISIICNGCILSVMIISFSTVYGMIASVSVLSGTIISVIVLSGEVISIICNGCTSIMCNDNVR